MSIFFTIPIYSMQNSMSMQRKVINSLAEIVEGYCGYQFTILTSRSLTNFDKISYFASFALFNFYKIKLYADPIQDINKISHGFEKLVKKVVIPKSYFIKKIINYSKILLGFGGATYFYVGLDKHKYAYCAGAILFAFNAYTNGTFEKKSYCSIVQTGLKNFLKKSDTIDRYIQSLKAFIK